MTPNRPQSRSGLMSQLGRKAKYSRRAHVFCFGPNNGHLSTGSACLFGAMSRHRSKQRYLSGSLAAVGEAAVAIECETEMRS
jgi:hypothetical protein